jgi:hypothetical protein
MTIDQCQQQREERLAALLYEYCSMDEAGAKGGETPLVLMSPSSRGGPMSGMAKVATAESGAPLGSPSKEETPVTARPAATTKRPLSGSSHPQWKVEHETKRAVLAYRQRMHEAAEQQAADHAIQQLAKRQRNHETSDARSETSGTVDSPKNGVRLISVETEKLLPNGVALPAAPLSLSGPVTEVQKLSLQFEHLLHQAARDHGYTGHRRERLMALLEAFQEQETQQCYHNRHPLRDVVISSYDEQWWSQHPSFAEAALGKCGGKARGPHAKHARSAHAAGKATHHPSAREECDSTSEDVREVLGDMTQAWGRYTAQQDRNASLVKQLATLPQQPASSPDRLTFDEDGVADSLEAPFSHPQLMDNTAVVARITHTLRAEHGLQSLLQLHEEAVRQLHTLDEAAEQSFRELLEK